jgi:hypothetical protein
MAVVGVTMISLSFDELKASWLQEGMKYTLARRYWHYRSGEISSYIGGKRWIWRTLGLAGTDGLFVPTHWRIVE